MMSHRRHTPELRCEIDDLLTYNQIFKFWKSGRPEQSWNAREAEQQDIQLLITHFNSIPIFKSPSLVGTLVGLVRIGQGQ